LREGCELPLPDKFRVAKIHDSGSSRDSTPRTDRIFAVILLEPNRTNYDLHFWLFGVSVRIHPMFWLLSAVLGWSWMEIGFEYVLVWIACVFVSILIHEMGHVFMGRVFGTDSYVVLYSFGGLAVGANALANRWKRIAVCFAGPAGGFLLLGILMLILRLLAPDNFDILLDEVRKLVGLDPLLPPRFPTVTDAIIIDMVFINLSWGLMNLLPIWPLDGGQICRDSCTWLSRHNGVRISLGISFVLAGILAIHCLMAAYDQPLIPFLGRVGGKFPAIMFGLLALQSFAELQQQSQKPWREEYPDPWERSGRDW
jgi:Zn-dependent protease